MTGLKKVNLTQKKIADFLVLYNRCLAGRRWLVARESAGYPCELDKADFRDKVVQPTIGLWRQMNAQEKQLINALLRTGWEFDAQSITPVAETQGELELDE